MRLNMAKNHFSESHSGFPGRYLLGFLACMDQFEGDIQVVTSVECPKTRWFRSQLGPNIVKKHFLTKSPRESPKGLFPNFCGGRHSGPNWQSPLKVSLKSIQQFGQRPMTNGTNFLRNLQFPPTSAHLATLCGQNKLTLPVTKGY